MSWCNVLQRAGSDHCVNDNFLGAFVNFCLKMLTQDRIRYYVDLSVKSSTVRCLSNAFVKMFRSCCERTLKCYHVDSGWYFRKKYHNNDESCSHPVVLLLLFLDKK